MKRMIHKLGSKKGETLVEILVAVLIVALAATIFGSLYAVSMSINMSARKRDKEFYETVKDLEEKMDSAGGTSGTGEPNLNYEPTGEGDAGGTLGTNVQFYTEDGITVYYGGE